MTPLPPWMHSFQLLCLENGVRKDVKRCLKALEIAWNAMDAHRFKVTAHASEGTSYFPLDEAMKRIEELGS